MAPFNLLVLTILTFASLTSGQRLSFLRLPPSVSLKSAGDSAPLDADQLEALVANLVGLPTNLDWSGLPTFSSLDRPKANLLFVVEGGRIDSPTDLGFDDAGVRIEHADSDGIFEAFRGLGLRLQSTFADSPLLLFNPDVEPEASSNSLDSVNAALEAGFNVVDRLGGALKMSQALNPTHLNATSAPDARFFEELSEIQLLVDSLGNSAVQSLVDDATPDLLLFRIRSVEGVVDAYGRGSSQVDEMKALLKRFVEKVTAEVENRYADRVAVELITLPRKEEAPREEAPLRRDKRATAAPSKDKNNIASAYNWSYAATFNMSIWTGVILIAVVYLIAFSMWNMDPGRDGYVYRMTMSKNK